ncbi:hypothetical protein [Pseudomonas serbica]|uniref:hypothetical protein n=1 Tax=Pseudomonas serbica TaxID=2965074 RepID=UPI00237A198E|nr:hypothetical protein [Pseudomonas serbica]
MDMTYCSDPSHFFTSHIVETTGDVVVLTRPVTYPGLEFDSALESLKGLTKILQQPQHIFGKVLSTIPKDGLRESLQRYLDSEPTVSAYEQNALTYASVEEATAMAAAHGRRLAFAQRAVNAGDDELAGMVSMIQIDIQEEEYVLYAGSPQNEFTFIAIPIPLDTLNMTPEELERMQIATEGEEVCPYCADGRPHPDDERHEGEITPDIQPAKRTLN